MSASRCPHCHSPLAAAEQVCPACGKTAPGLRAAGPRATGRIGRSGRLLLLGLAALLLAGPLAGFLALRSARQSAQAEQTATALAASTPGASLTPGPGTAEPVEAQHKVLRIRGEAWPETIDPQRVASPEELSLSALLYERLTRVDEQGTVVPAAAEGWELSSAADVITFTLRANLTYSDGTPLTAQRFADALRRALSPAIVGEFQYVLFDIAGAAELASTPLTDTAALDPALAALGVSAPDEQTLVIRLNGPAAHFPAVMSLPIAAPFRTDLDVGKAERWLEARAAYVGNGPFMLGEVERDQRVQLVPNPRYWGGRPRLSALDYIYITDPDVALDAYRHGELDIVRVTTPQLGLADDEAVLRQDLVAYPQPYTRMLSFNLTRPPFDDVHVRRAFAYAFDRATWCHEIRNGDCLPALSWVPPGIAGAYEEDAYAFDPEAARAELTQSRYAGAMPEITLWYSGENSANKPRAEWIAAELEQQLGVKIDLDSSDYLVLPPARGTPAALPQLTFGGWIGDYPDAQNWISYWHSTSKPARDVGYASPALDELLDRADGELDAATRTDLYVQAGRLLAEDAPAIFTDHEANFYLVKPYVTGYTTSTEDRGWPGEASSPLTIDVTRAVAVPPVEPSPSFEPAPTPGPTEPHDAFAPTSTPALVQPALTPTAAADDPDLSPSPIRVPTYVIPQLEPARPPADGVLRIHQASFPVTLDPHFVSFTYEIAVVALLYEGLTRIDGRSQVVPGAAERWELSADATVVTFTLRAGLTYSDGVPLTAADYERAIRRALAPSAGEDGAEARYQEFQYQLFDVVGAEQLAMTPYTDTAALLAAQQALGVSSPDARTLVFRLKGPGRHFPSILSLPIVAPVREDVAARGPGWHLDPRKHVGNGPFVLAGFEQDQRIQLRPNPRYWGGRPRLGGLDYVYIEDEERALRAYQEGQVDILLLGTNHNIGRAGELLPSQAQRVEADPALRAELVRFPQLFTFAFHFNLTKPPFDDLKVRQAFAYAFDAATWCRELRADCVPAQGWVPPGVPGASAAWAYPFDPDRARAALAESSYGGAEGLPPITFVGSVGSLAGQRRVEWLVEQLNRHLGISMTLDLHEGSCLAVVRLKALASADLPQIGNGGGTCQTWESPSRIGDYLDPHDWLDARWTCAGETASVMGYCNPVLDERIAAAERELDPARRLALYAEAERLLLADVPALFAYHGAAVFLVKPYVTGYAPTPQDLGWPGQTASQLTIAVDR